LGCIAYQYTAKQRSAAPQGDAALKSRIAVSNTLSRPPTWLFDFLSSGFISDDD